MQPRSQAWSVVYAARPESRISTEGNAGDRFLSLTRNVSYRAQPDIPARDVEAVPWPDVPPKPPRRAENARTTLASPAMNATPALLPARPTAFVN